MIFIDVSTSKKALKCLSCCSMCLFVVANLLHIVACSLLVDWEMVNSLLDGYRFVRG